MVGDAEMTVSPSSSSTRRSTPCVLGCCGPMLTVIVSVRSSGIFYRITAEPPQRTPRTQRENPKGLILGVLCVLCGESLVNKGSLHQIANHMEQRPVHFLHPRRRLGRHVDV